MLILTSRRIGQAPRQVQLLPWQGQGPAPWNNGYSRVAIPYNEVELRNSRDGSKFHTQIVRNSRLKSVKEPRIKLAKRA